MRIGVFICHCGTNIAGMVDIPAVIEATGKLPHVALAQEYKYLCSDPGQTLIKKAIKEHVLEGVVVAACTPNMHESTFRKAVKEAGLNQYKLEIANIREYCSWVHDDPVEATEKAIKMVRSSVRKVMANEELYPAKVPVTKSCLVVGGGISGIQAALDVAEKGYEVHLVERTATIGGHMAQLSETFPTLDCSQCILTPKMVAVQQNPLIHLHTLSEVEDVSGYVGNFKVSIKKRARYVDEDKCTLCGDCEQVCPQVAPSEFDMGLKPRKAIHIPFPQAVPSSYVLDEGTCLGLRPLRCEKCRSVCEVEAIDYDMTDQLIDVDVGAIILATGFDVMPTEVFEEYGHGRYPDVITSLEFERILSSSGPTRGKIVRPSDGKVPQRVVFIQCVGSRDPEHHKPYCSKICCMYTAKHALLYKHQVHDGRAHVFYIDKRSAGKGYEEFVENAIESERLNYLRGKVSKVFEEDGEMVVWGVDTNGGRKVEVRADLVVLATAVVSRPETAHLAALMKAGTDAHGFLNEAHPKLRPVESLTSGVFLAGAAQAPKDIPESVGQASGAASKAVSIISQKKLEHEPTTAKVSDLDCSGCGVCESVCPYKAITIDENRNISMVNEVLCEGCGTCAASCPSGAMTMKNSSDGQIMSMIRAILGKEVA